MKKTFIALILVIGTIAAQAQDQVYTINNWNGDGITQQLMDPANGAISGTGTNYGSGGSMTTSTAMALNSSGYIYFIPEATNTGNFEVRSIAAYPTATQTIVPTLNTNVLTGQLPTTNRVFFRRLGINPAGWAYLVAMDQTTGTIYFAKFQTAADGTASNFTNLGTITLSDGPTSSFYNGDLLFDANGNMYVLANADVTNGVTKIYKASAATVASATAGSSIELTYQATVLNPDGQNFYGAVTGAAFTSTGNLYITAQDPADPNSGNTGIFMLNKLSGNIVATPTSVKNNGIGDIATSYFPASTILPVNYGNVSAKIMGNSLIVNWQTTSETNNKQFDVEISKDGKNFTKVGTVASKAANGNSSEVLNYEFSTPLNGAMALFGMSLLSLSFVLLMLNRKNRLMFSLIAFVGISLLTTSCSKQADQVDTDTTGKVYVRLAQTDKDGKTHYSEVKTAYKAD